MASGSVAHQCNTEGIQLLCRQIAEGSQPAANCPCCSSPLRVALSIEDADVSCPAGCFHFNCRRDLITGAFVTGTLEFTQVTGTTTALSASIPSPATDRPRA